MGIVEVFTNTKFKFNLMLKIYFPRNCSKHSIEIQLIYSNIFRKSKKLNTDGIIKFINKKHLTNTRKISVC